MFEITDYHELVALSKALHEARYHAQPDNLEVAASPFVAAIHERVLAALFEHDELSAERVRDWLLWKNRTIEPERVRQHLTICGWDKCPNESKREFVETLVRPFLATEDEIDALVAFANAEAR